MHYKMLQKQCSQKTSLKIAQKFFFFLKEGISCYKTLKQVTMRYKILQKQRSQRTSLKFPKKLFFYKGGDKLL